MRPPRPAVTADTSGDLQAGDVFAGAGRRIVVPCERAQRRFTRFGIGFGGVGSVPGCGLAA
jgi:hypothetical protein